MYINVYVYRYIFRLCYFMEATYVSMCSLPARMTCIYVYIGSMYTVVWLSPRERSYNTSTLLVFSWASFQRVTTDVRRSEGLRFLAILLFWTHFRLFFVFFCKSLLFFTVKKKFTIGFRFRKIGNISRNFDFFRWFFSWLESFGFSSNWVFFGASRIPRVAIFRRIPRWSSKYWRR